MNSRGTLMSQRNSGDTLASSDKVAMTPTVQPAAAGTQWYREVGLLSDRDFKTVTDREDIPLNREIPGDGPVCRTAVACRVRLPGPVAGRPGASSIPR